MINYSTSLLSPKSVPGLKLLDPAGDTCILAMVSVFKGLIHILEDKMKILLIIADFANV